MKKSGKNKRKTADFSTAKEITAAINIFAFHFWPMTKIKDTAAGKIIAGRSKRKEQRIMARD